MKTEIAILLDRSGSMGSLVDDTIGGVNTFLREQAAAPGEARLTLVQFDHEYWVPVESADIRLVMPLTRESYVPRGTTALLDAMARLIDETGARLARMPPHHRPDKVIVVIVTDGYENASRVFTRQQVFDKVTHQRRQYQWEFVYLGANQDAIAVGHDMGIPHTHALNYDIGTDQMRAMYRSVSQNVNSVRSGATMTMAWSDEDRVAAKGDGTVTTPDSVTTTTGTTTTWTAGD